MCAWWVAVGAHGNAIQRSKDPEAPKRPRTAYICFITENMERLRNDTGKPQKDIMRMLGESWKVVVGSQACAC